MEKRKTGSSYVQNGMIDDDSLTAEHLALLVYLGSHSKEWVSRSKVMMKRFGFGKNKLSRLLRELRQSGRVSRQAAYDSKTKEKMGTVYTVHHPPLHPQFRDVGRYPTSPIQVDPKKGPIKEPIHKRRSTETVIDNGDRF